MQGYIHELSGRTRGLIFGIFTLVVIFFAVFYLFPSQRIDADVIRSNTEASSIHSPNVVTVGMADAATNLSEAFDSLGNTLQKSTSNLTAILARSGRSVLNGMSGAARYTGGAIGSGLKTMGSVIGTSVSFMIKLPSNLLDSATDTALVSAIIKPADSTPVPTIDLDSIISDPIPTAEPAAEVLTTQTTQLTDATAIWPMHGTITTQFGVPHRPYQPVHTGIDISDGQPVGVTPVKPFKPGRVIDTIISRQGLGNHVIIDHGNGLTSVYGHLASITVQKDQEVNHDSVLGYQGSTGVSTGTHLHFEILVNNQPMDPRQFITGLP